MQTKFFTDSECDAQDIDNGGHSPSTHLLSPGALGEVGAELRDAEVLSETNLDIDWVRLIHLASYWYANHPAKSSKAKRSREAEQWPKDGAPLCRALIAAGSTRRDSW